MLCSPSATRSNWARKSAWPGWLVPSATRPSGLANPAAPRGRSRRGCARRPPGGWRGPRWPGSRTCTTPARRWSSTVVLEGVGFMASNPMPCPAAYSRSPSGSAGSSQGTWSEIDRVIPVSARRAATSSIFSTVVRAPRRPGSGRTAFPRCRAPTTGPPPRLGERSDHRLRVRATAAADPGDEFGEVPVVVGDQGLVELGDSVLVDHRSSFAQDVGGRLSAGTPAAMPASTRTMSPVVWVSSPLSRQKAAFAACSGSTSCLSSVRLA